MKTTIDIPDEDLEALTKHTRAKTKRDAVLIAIRAFNRLRDLEALNAELKGSFRDFMTSDELHRSRHDA